MPIYKTVLSEKQLAAALVGLDREARLFLRNHGDTDAFRDQFIRRTTELWDTISPRDLQRASASIDRIISDLGIDSARFTRRVSAAA